MINNIEEYLAELRQEMKGCDRATIQDALADAEEYLRTSMTSYREANPDVPESAALEAIIERYGAPGEVAAAYRDIESHTPTAFTTGPVRELKPAEAAPSAPISAPDTRPWIVKFFGIYADPRAWGAFLYLIFSLGTGILFFTWAVTGFSLSVGLMVLIVGIPLALLFLLSVRGIALVEGRIVEALTGVRMPRRPLFSRQDIGWWQKLKGILTSPRTWTAMVYMVLQLPLGIFYFTAVVTLVSVSLWGIAIPILQYGFGLPLFYLHGVDYRLGAWVTVFTVIVGILLLTATMHLIKLAGRGHGMWAKTMLVVE